MSRQDFLNDILTCLSVSFKSVYLSIVFIASTEVQYGPSPGLNASSFSSENYFPPTNLNTEPGKGN